MRCLLALPIGPGHLRKKTYIIHCNPVRVPIMLHQVSWILIPTALEEEQDLSRTQYARAVRSRDP